MEVDMLDNDSARTQVENKVSSEERKVKVEEEINRMHHLPANSAYAIHRLRVLNHILHLMSIQRSKSQEEELELLFTKLSI